MSQSILIDTHALLWFTWGHEKLSDTARQAIESPENKRHLSIASLWEISLKVSHGKLKINRPMAQFVQKYVEGADIQVLGIELSHLDAFMDLSFHHKDPFDRIMIAQARVEELTLVSCDEHFSKYDVDIIW